MIYDEAFQRCAEMIYLKQEMTDNSKSPWGNNLGFSQHEDLAPQNGLPIFVKSFITNKPENARLVFTALGCVDIWINGERIGTDELKPGWSDYKVRTLYYEYDVTQALRDGENRILAVVSNGWYSGRIAGGYYGDRDPAVMLCLTVKDADGENSVVTDESWRCKIGGQVLAADIWDGEFCDGRQDSYAAMSTPGFDVSGWGTPKVCGYFDGRVTKFVGPTVQVRDELGLKAETVTVHSGVVDNGSEFGEINVVQRKKAFPASARRGEKITVDLGQEIVGWVKIKVRAAAGTTVKMRFAEMLNDSGDRRRGNDGPKGSVYTINYRTAKAKAYYVANGSGIEEYRPTFSFFGFRYIELSATADFEIVDLDAQVVGSATRETGHIETSVPLINKLISNIIWGQRSNYLFIPTDCPQRDERLGWTGDTQAFSVTAAYNADVLGFFRKWLQDMRDSQSEAGAFPDVAPRVGYCASEAATGWSDAGIIVPYNMYKMYGDLDIVSEHFDAMERYIAHLVDINGMSGANPRYGDWLAYEFCKNEFISSAYFVHCLDMMTELSLALEKNDRAEHYAQLRKSAYKYFTDNFMENGELKGDTQTDYIISLAFDLLEDGYAEKAAARLDEKIRENGNRLSSGFLGTYNLCPALSKMGYDNLAYTLLMQRSEPSWLYSIDQGATTVWERWNSYTLDKGFGDVGMNSFNHYAYGAVEEWMYRFMAGIEAGSAGFKSILLQPRIDTRNETEIPAGQEKMRWVRASYESAAGLIESSWSTEDGFVYECTVPQGAGATLMLPLFAEKFTVNGVEHSAEEFERRGKCAVIGLGAGKYIFEEV